jgi:hypothetical protein
MDGNDAGDAGVKYLSPPHAQIWFLKRSRKTWKGRCRELRARYKQATNQAADASKSRKMWRERARAAVQRAKALAAQNETLKHELQALKKSRGRV